MLWEILKASKGILVTDLYADLWANIAGGGTPVDVFVEMIGTLPLYYNGKGYNLTDYLISGNTVQDGTPSADAPVEVQGNGVRTGNLAPPVNEWFNGYISGANGALAQPTEIYMEKSSGFLEIPNNTVDVAFSGEDMKFEAGQSEAWRAIGFYDSDKKFVSRAGGTGRNSMSASVPEGARFMRVSCRTYGSEKEYMLNLGSTALPYEPYGFKLPLTVNGTEYPIYLGTVPTTRRIKKLVMTGEETITSYTGFGAENCFFVSKSGVVADAGLCNIYSNASTLSDLIRTNNSFMNSTNTVRIHDSRFASPDDLKSYLAAQYAAGTPVTVWYVLAEPETGIVNEPLMKIGDYADTVSFAQAGVAIPTVNGANVLDMASPVKPSEVYIKGKGIKPTDVNGQ